MARPGRGRPGPSPLEWICGATIVASLILAAGTLLGSIASRPDRPRPATIAPVVPPPAPAAPVAVAPPSIVAPSPSHASAAVASPAAPAPAPTVTLADAPAAPESDDALDAASIQKLWIRAADAPDADAAIERLDRYVREHDYAAADTQLAMRARDDLIRLRDRRADPARFAGPGAPAETEAEAAERIAELGDVLRYSDDTQTIDEALGELGARGGAAAAAAILSAGPLPDPDQRARGLQLLWRMAADGESGDPRGVRDRLERARYATDPEELRIAEEAIADLDRLDETPPPATDDAEPWDVAAQEAALGGAFL